MKQLTQKREDSMADSLFVSSAPIRNLLKRGGQSPRSTGNQSTEAGLSLVECLVAIAVIAITASVILPPLFISAATRVQNRRAEQALQVAQGEVDRVRTLVMRGNHTPANLPSVVTFPGNNPRDYAPPSSTSTSLIKSVAGTCAGRTAYTGGPVAPREAIPVDLDGDCAPELFMQVFRNSGSTTTVETAASGQQRPEDFDLGVRVYSVVANGNWGSMTTPVEPANLQLTSAQGNQRLRPLSVLYTEIPWTERSGTLCDFQREAGRTRC